MATIMNSPQSARKTLRHVFSNCSSLAKKLNGPEAKSPATAALLWLQLSLPFLAEEIIWHNADIVGLVSRNDCQSDRAALLTPLLTAGVPIIRDKHGLCPLNSVSFVVLRILSSPYSKLKHTPTRTTHPQTNARPLKPFPRVGLVNDVLIAPTNGVRMCVGTYSTRRQPFSAPPMRWARRRRPSRKFSARVNKPRA